MPEEISAGLRKLIIQDAIKHAKHVGAYQAYDWLESYLVYLQRKEYDGRPDNRKSGN
jgi:hypothetical protein